MIKSVFFPSKPKEIDLCPKGFANTGCTVTIILIILLGLVGYKVGGAYWDYYEAREKVRDALTWAVAGQEKPEMEIVNRVIVNVDEVGIKLTPRNIRVVQSSSSLTINASWSREIDFLLFTFPLNFQINLTEIKRWGRGGLVVK